MNELNFVKVSKESLLGYISNSKERIIIAKPGYFEEEIRVILRQLEEYKVEVRLYLEEGDQAIRFGFGDEKALDLIKDNIELLNVQTANHIRLSVIIVDHQILVYTPSALSWEDEPKDIGFPNGLLGGPLLVNKMMDQFNINKNQQISITDAVIEQINTTDKIVSFEKFKGQKEEKEVAKNKILETISELEENPSTDPRRLKKTMFYRNNYKLIHVTVKGRINNKTIDLSPFNRLIKSTEERLKSSWRLFTSEELKNIDDYKDYLNEIEEIKKKYTIDAKKFGLLIDIKCIKEFKEALQKEKEKFKNKENNDSALASILDKSKEALIKYMIRVDNDDAIYNSNRFIKSMPEFENDKERGRKEAMKMFIMDRLKFPMVKELIENIDIETHVFDVSDELIHEDDKFKALMEKYKTPDENGLKIRSYSDGYEKR